MEHAWNLTWHASSYVKIIKGTGVKRLKCVEEFRDFLRFKMDTPWLTLNVGQENP